MLCGYFIILTIPVLIIVPFSAFRSLAAEREDGTFELLSITALSSRQIVTGKLGSAMLQMLIYYSALAPCIAFTYLSNPNGATADIAGILSPNRRVLGMMPHPERAVETAQGGVDGAALFASLMGGMALA